MQTSGFRCFQPLFDNSVATLRCSNRTTGTPEGKTLQILAYNESHIFSFIKIPDISRTVSRRSELKSRTTLLIEQINPY